MLFFLQHNHMRGFVLARPAVTPALIIHLIGREARAWDGDAAPGAAGPAPQVAGGVERVLGAGRLVDEQEPMEFVLVAIGRRLAGEFRIDQAIAVTRSCRGQAQVEFGVGDKRTTARMGAARRVVPGACDIEPRRWRRLLRRWVGDSAVGGNGAQVGRGRRAGAGGAQA